MTTAPTLEEVHALADRLEHCVAKWGKQNALSLEAYSAVKMMRRLQAENERLQHLLQCDTPRYCSSVQRCTAGDEHRAELEARKPLPPMEAIKLGMEAQQACRPHSTGTTNWAFAMTRFYEHSLCGTTGGSS